MIKIKFSILLLFFSYFSYSQSVEYVAEIKQECKVYKSADLSSTCLKNYKKGTKLKVLGKESDFVKTVEGNYIHKDFVQISSTKNKRYDTQIDILVHGYKQNISEKSKKGLNLNGNSRDFIELPSRDTIKIESIKFEK